MKRDSADDFDRRIETFVDLVAAVLTIVRPPGTGDPMTVARRWAAAIIERFSLLDEPPSAIHERALRVLAVQLLDPPLPDDTIDLRARLRATAGDSVGPLAALLEHDVKVDERLATLSAVAAFWLAGSVCGTNQRISDDEAVHLATFREQLRGQLSAHGRPFPDPDDLPELLAEIEREMSSWLEQPHGFDPAHVVELQAEDTLETALDELDAMVGLDTVKQEVRELSSLAQMLQWRQAAGLPVGDFTHHLVFTGNPGTGKTTVGRLLGRIYAAVGLLDDGEVHEVARQDLVAAYVGQTAGKTAEVVEQADGGVLMLDEAYTLTRQAGTGGRSDYGQEALDTILKLMEDRRGRFIVIATGYPTLMADFVAANPGLRSRFKRTIHFPDYSTEELLAIFALRCSQQHYILTPDVEMAVRELIAAVPRDDSFGNARLVRAVFERMQALQASRLVAAGRTAREDLTTFLVADVPEVPTTIDRPQREV